MTDQLHHPHENEFRLATSEQVKLATTLTDEVIGEFSDDKFDWPVNKYEHRSLQRGVFDANDAIIGTKLTLEEQGRLQITRYLLDLQTGAFIIIPELHGALVEDADDTDEDTIEMLYALGHHLATDTDWDDFIALIKEGRDYLTTLRSLEAKLGLSLGKAATRVDWDNLPMPEQ